MAFVRKTWLDRISEEPQRRVLTPTDGSTPLEVDVTRNEGVVTQEGDAFSAANMNDLEGRIEAGMGAGDVLIAGTETSSISTNAYTIGQYLIHSNLLYRVTAAIAVGNSLVEGVNITQVRIADELSNHLVVNGTPFYFDVHDGEYGYNTSELRGADTFVPFKRSTAPMACRLTASGVHYQSFRYSNFSGTISFTMSGSGTISGGTVIKNGTQTTTTTTSFVAGDVISFSTGGSANSSDGASTSSPTYTITFE